MLMQYNGYSQDKLYVTNGLEFGYIDLAGYTYKFVSDAIQFGDIAITPQGKIYGIAGNYLSEIDPVLNTYNNVPVDISGLYFSGANSMVSDRDGNLFVTGGSGLYRINTKTGRMSLVGYMSLSPSGDLCFADGKLYMAARNNVLLEMTLGPSGNSIVSERIVGTMNLVGDVYSIGANENGICYVITTRKELALVDTEDATTYIISKPLKGNITQIDGLAMTTEGANDKDIELCGNGIDDDHNGFTDDNDMACRLQRGLCSSESQPIFQEDFGTGAGYGNALPGLGNSAYRFSTSAPLAEGYYTIIDNPRTAQGNTTWKKITDHSGKPGGRMMIVNGSHTPGEFYRKKVSGLCGGYQYAISVSACSVVSADMHCGQDVTAIPSRIRFRIEDENGKILGQLAERYIPADADPAAKWKEYGMIFTLPDNVTSIQIVLLNDAPGGCGNDLAIDDIIFSTCKPTPAISLNGSYNGPFKGCINTDAVFRVDTSALRLHQPFFQWQKQAAGSGLWNNIAGANNIAFVIAELQPEDAGQYRVLISENPAATCGKNAVSLAVDLEVINTPKLRITPPLTVCIGERVYLDVTPYDKLREARWIYPNGDQTTGVMLEVTRKAALSDAGEYKLKIRTSDDCSGILNTSVTVLAYEAADFSFATAAVCVGQPVQVQAHSTHKLSGWQWTASNNGEVSQQNIEAPLITWNTPGSRELTLNATGQCLLMQPVIHKITIKDAASPGNLNAPAQVCVGMPLEMTVSNFSGDMIDWNITGNPVITGSMDKQQAIWDNTGTYTISYTVSGSCGSVTPPAPQTVIVKDPPTISLGNDTIVCKGTPLILQPVYSEDAVLFSWQEQSFVPESRYGIKQAGLYTVIAKDAWGCTSQAEINIQETNCGCNIFIPTAFSPNGDGINEVFKPVIHCVTASYEFRIYNRWGQLTFSSRTPDTGWNGMLANGRLAETGNYIWVVEYKSYEYPKAMLQTGVVTLLR